MCEPVALTRLNQRLPLPAGMQVTRLLSRAGLLDRLGGERVHSNMHAAVEHAKLHMSTPVAGV